MGKLGLLLSEWIGSLRGRKAAAPSVPTSAGDTYAVLRRQMVTEQLAAPGRDITDARLLSVMGRVPRHELVPPEVRGEAYTDHPLPIGHGQTISQPYVVAFMTEQLDPQPTDRVLEIGTGTGYQAAILAEMVAEVYSIDIVQELAQRAAADLKRLGYSNVHVRTGDGSKGWPEAAPFDAILAACAPREVPEALAGQLKEGGRMIIPVGFPRHQELILLHKRGGKLEQRSVLAVSFVPMVGEAEGGEEAEARSPKAERRPKSE